MDSRKRTFLKALSWQFIGLFSMTLIAWFFTGSASSSIGLALISAGVSLFTYVAHERCWQHIHWGRGHLK